MFFKKKLHASDNSPKGYFHLYYLRRTSKMKKNPILSRQIYLSQSKCWRECIIYLLLFLTLSNTTFPVMAKELVSGDMASSSCHNSNAINQADRFNSDSFLAASNSSTSSEKSDWTVMKEIETVVGVVTGLTIICSLGFKGYQMYQDRNWREIMFKFYKRDHLDGGTDGNTNLSDSEQRGVTVKAHDNFQGSGKEARDSSSNYADEVEEKFIAGISPLVGKEVLSYLEKANLSSTQRLNLLLYYSLKFLPNNAKEVQRFQQLFDENKEQLLSDVANFRNCFYNDHQKIGVYIAELQALSEIIEKFPDLQHQEIESHKVVSRSDTSFNKPRSQSLSDSDSTDSQIDLQPEEAEAYKAIIDHHIIENDKITVSQKLDLLAKLKNPFTNQETRLMIAAFRSYTEEEQQYLLNASGQSRITIETLLEKLQKDDQIKVLLNIVVNPKITYDEKLDLLAAATDIKTGSEMRSFNFGDDSQIKQWSSNYKHAYNLFSFDCVLKDVPQEMVTPSVKPILRKRFGRSEQSNNSDSTNLSYQDRWNLIWCYMTNKDKRAFILNSFKKPADEDEIIKPTEYFSVENDTLRSIAGLAKKWQQECWRKNIQSDVRVLIKRDQDDAEYQLPMKPENEPYNTSYHSIGYELESLGEPSLDKSTISDTDNTSLAEIYSKLKFLGKH